MGLDTVRSTYALVNYLVENDVNIQLNSKHIQKCITENILGDEALLFGNVDLTGWVKKAVAFQEEMKAAAESNPHASAVLENAKKAIQKLQELSITFPQVTVDRSPSLQLFLKTVAHKKNSCGFGEPQLISMQEAVKFACQNGERQEEIDLSLYGSKITYQDLKEIVLHCPNIKKFTIRNVQIPQSSNSERFMQLLSQFQNLEELVINNQSFDLSDYELLCQLHKLRFLDVSYSLLGDSALELIGQLPKLEVLWIKNKRAGIYGGYATYATDRGIQALSKCNSLKELDITEHKNISEDCLKELQKAIPNLLIKK